MVDFFGQLRQAGDRPFPMYMPVPSDWPELPAMGKRLHNMDAALAELGVLLSPLIKCCAASAGVPSDGAVASDVASTTVSASWGASCPGLPPLWLRKSLRVCHLPTDDATNQLLQLSLVDDNLFSGSHLRSGLEAGGASGCLHDYEQSQNSQQSQSSSAIVQAERSAMGKNRYVLPYCRGGGSKLRVVRQIINYS